MLDLPYLFVQTCPFIQHEGHEMATSDDKKIKL